MEKILSYKTDDIFTVYESRLNFSNTYQYICAKCEQRFAVDWNIDAPGFFYIPRGSNFFCPYCGNHNHKYIGIPLINGEIPDKFSVKVILYKHVVKFRIKYRMIKFTEMFCYKNEVYHEEFTFDFKKMNSFFTKKKGEAEQKGDKIHFKYKQNRIEIIPFHFGTIMQESVLRFVRYGAKFYESKELRELLRNLRSEFEKRLRDKHGKKEKIASTFIDTRGIESGYFLLQLLNFAYRLKSPFAMNLGREDGFKVNFHLYFWPDWFSEGNENINERIFESVRRGKDEITAILGAFELPNTQENRKKIEQDYSSAVYLKLAYELTKNHDFAAVFAAEFRKAKETKEYYSHIANPNDLAYLLYDLVPIYGENAVNIFLRNEKQLRDVVRMYQDIDEESKARLKREKPRLRDLHDELMVLYRYQNIKPMSFDVPEHVRNRLNMQLQSMRFNVPSKSEELLEVGMRLHNCVASYAKKMKEQKCCIVYMTDDNGKIVACLELQGDRLVQAKARGQKPISEFMKINAAVLAWCQAAGVQIDTYEVRQAESA